MSPTRKAPAKPKPSSEHARCRENERLINRVTNSLDVAQADLDKLRGRVGSGVSEMRRDLAKLLRDARRDARKLGTSTRKDLETLQKDLLRAARPASKTAAAKPGVAKSKPRAAKAASAKKAATKAKPARAAARAGSRAR